MGSFSIWHWMLFLAVALLLFGGKGKISDIMGDVAKGMRSFKKGMSDDETTDAKADAPARSLENRAASPVDVNDKQKVGLPTTEFSLETPYRGPARAVPRFRLARPLHVRSRRQQTH